MGNLAWQTQITLALMLLGGGYVLFYNRMPPFDKGGLVDQISKYLPKSNLTPSDSLSDSIEPSPDMGQPQTLPFPHVPGQQGLPPMDNPLPLKPTYPDYKVYNDYATALRMQYGQGNNPNLGNGVGGVFGDFNLGTTPIDPSILGLSGSQMSSQPPPYPFLPSPLTPNVGMMQPPRAFPAPYPPMPYPLPPWIYQPIIPVGQPYWATWAVKRPLPYIYSIQQLYNIDLGIIDTELTGITINTFLEMGVKLNTIFPNGVNLGNQYQIGVDLTEFVTVYLRLHKIKPSRNSRHRNSHGIGIDIDLGNLGGSINDMVKSIMDKVKGKIGGIGSSGSSGGLGDLFGGLFGNGSNTNVNIDDGDTPSIPGPATGNNNGNNMFGNLFGNLFGGSSGSSGTSSNNINYNTNSGSSLANSINSNVFNQLRSMGIPGFHARAMMADVTPKQGFLNQRGSSSLQPHIKRTKHRNNGYLKRVSFT